MSDATGARAYMEAARAQLDGVVATQMPAIGAAAAACHAAVARGGMIWLFGTGHSSLLAVEGLHRAGGLACVCPIQGPGLLMHERADLGTRLERLPGYAAIVVDQYPLAAGDVLIVFSNSGANAVPVEAAARGREKGLTVIAVLAARYAATLAPRVPAGKLADLAQVVIDNGGPPGDALVPVAEGLGTGPGSTVAGAFILNAVLAEVVARITAAGGAPPVFVSSNMPGAEAHNAALVERYRARNPHL